MTPAYSPLDPAELETALDGLPGWRVEDDAIITAYAAPNAAAALALFASIGEAAEAANHHPDIDWRYDHLFILITSHDAGSKVTRKDIDLALRISSLADAAGAKVEPASARIGA